MFNSIDVASADVAGLANGFGRDPQRNRSHAFIGPLTKIPAVPRLIDGALSVEIDASIAADTLSVDVALTNVGCGHAIPTGEPLRAVVLVVDATACDVPLTPTGGLLIPGRRRRARDRRRGSGPLLRRYDAHVGRGG
jgi:hypothetical protein